MTKVWRKNPICIDCQKSISNHYAQRCRSCAGKIRKIPSNCTMKGKHHSIATKEKIRKTRKNKYPSIITKEKMSEAHKGPKHFNWKGGKIKTLDGYILIKKWEHPFCNKNGYVYEHRLAIEKQIGRYLKSEEFCHHVNEIKNDNRIKNLMLFKNGGYHLAFHRWGHCNIKGIIFDGRKLKEKKK